MTIQSNFPAIKPSLMLDFANTKQLDSRITYTRASTASYYDGVTTSMAEQNIFQYSQEFDNAYWIKSNTSITANSTTAPDGTTTADTVSDGVATGYHQLDLNVNSATAVGNTYTISCYVKNIDRQYFNISFYGQSNAYAAAIYDVSGGTVSSTGQQGTGWSVVSTSITNVGSGWYRCVLTAVTGSLGTTRYVSLCPSNTGTMSSSNYGIITYTGSSKQLYVWGAQLEQRSSATAYTATTTQPITNYIPVLLTAGGNQPRFDCNPTTGESLGLLIEEQRTNLFTYSEQFDNAAWTKQSSTVTANAIVSPNGSLDGEKLDETTANDTHRLEQNVTTVNGTVYTLSVFAKAAERQWVYLFEDSATNACTFNLATGAVGTTQGSVTASISSVGNGWYRCSLTYTQSGTTGRMRIAVANGTSTTSYTGVANNGIFIWGAQVEAGAFATSYIPTVASQVTRAADAASMTGTNFSTWYNQGEGTIYVQTLTSTLGGDKYQYEIGDGTSSNRFSVVSTVTNQENYIITNGVIEANAFFGISRATPIKNALGYKVNDVRAGVNGNLSLLDTTVVIPLVNTLFLGSARSSLAILNGTISKFAYYPVRIQNSQLQALTS